MTQNAEMREKMFTIRMSSDETERLEVVAKHFGLSAAGAIRMLVKEKFDAIRPADALRAEHRTMIEAMRMAVEEGDADEGGWISREVFDSETFGSHLSELKSDLPKSAIPRLLNELVRSGHLERSKIKSESGHRYRVTSKPIGT